MNAKEIEDFRKILRARLEQLGTEDDLGREGQKTVTLDQQSVGRLSRMDAMQQQAMAKAISARRAQMRARLTAALKRIKDGEFGYCVQCGEDIAVARLRLDPTVPTCISCARTG